MQIARIRHLFYPDLPKDFFYEVSSNQIKMGNGVDVFTWARNCKPSVEKVSEGFTIHRIHGLNFAIPGYIQEYPYLPSLASALNLSEPDVVHAESHLFLPSVQAVKYAKKHGIPSVVSVHGVFADRNFILNFPQKLYLRSVGVEIFKCADAVICLTLGDAEEIMKLGCPQGKIKVIANGVDTMLFRPSGENRDKQLVTWVGRFVPEKGLQYLVEAAKIVADKYDVSFALIGFGPLESKIIELVQKIGLSSVVHFLGRLTRPEVAEILRRSSIFVLPSLKEGMPVALLEAMASGNAIIASNIAGTTEIVKNYQNGIIVPPRNSKELAFSILKLLNDKELRNSMSREARKTIEARFSLDRTLAAFENVYASICN